MLAYDAAFFQRVSYLRAFPALADPAAGSLWTRAAMDFSNLFILGSELVGLTRVREAGGRYPAVIVA